MRKLIVLIFCALTLSILANTYILITGQAESRFMAHALLQLTAIFTLLCIADLFISRRMTKTQKVIYVSLILGLPLLGPLYYFGRNYLRMPSRDSN